MAGLEIWWHEITRLCGYGRLLILLAQCMFQIVECLLTIIGLSHLSPYWVILVVPGPRLQLYLLSVIVLFESSFLQDLQQKHKFNVYHYGGLS